jgi:hypothetical protein
LSDSTGSDLFHGLPEYAIMVGVGFDNYAEGFEQVRAYSHHGGADEARLYGSNGDDRFHGLPEYSVMNGLGFDNYAEGFDLVYAKVNQGGFDDAYLYDSSGDDLFIGRPTSGTLSGDAFRNVAVGFDALQVRSGRGGHDRATIYGQKTDQVFANSNLEQRLKGIAYQFETHDVSSVSAAETTELHRTLAELVARDEFYRSVSAAINSDQSARGELLRDFRDGDGVIVAFGFHAIDFLLQDAKDWI